MKINKKNKFTAKKMPVLKIKIYKSKGNNLQYLEEIIGEERWTL